MNLIVSDGIDYDFSWFKEKFNKEATYNCDIQVFIFCFYRLNIELTINYFKITRSSGPWSSGLNTTEQSILNVNLFHNNN